MNVFPLFSRALSESWRGLIGWSLGIAATVLLYIPLYPSMRTQSMQSLMASLPKELVKTLGYSLSTGSGYVESTYFGLMGFLLLSIAAVGWGTLAIAGDEESGALELTLAHGVSRTSVVLERTAAILLRIFILGLVGGLLILAFNDTAQLAIDPPKLAAATGALIGLAMLTATAAMAAGAITGRKRVALVVGTAVPVLSYALNAVANQSAALNGLHPWSPYAWAFGNTPLSSGADWAGLGLLYGVSAALTLIATFALNHRGIDS